MIATSTEGNKAMSNMNDEQNHDLDLEQLHEALLRLRSEIFRHGCRRPGSSAGE
jgi:hypothetical protein